MIVYRHYRPKSRPRKPTQPVTLAVPRIVQVTPKGKAWRPLPDDAEADQRVAAFLAQMIRPAPG